MVDGQHRLAAIIEADVPVDITVFTEVPDGAFDVLDTGKRRNAADVLAIEGEKSAVMHGPGQGRPTTAVPASDVRPHPQTGRTAIAASRDPRTRHALPQSLQRLGHRRPIDPAQVHPKGARPTGRQSPLTSAPSVYASTEG
jgi:hypothetical protein